MFDDHCFMFVVLKIKDWLICEERISGAWFQHLGQSSFTNTCRGRARSKHGGDVDGVFLYTKHVHYTLVGFDYGTNPPLGTLII
jgi:hypothetical protein